MATFLMIFVVVCVLLLVIVTLSTVYVVRQQSVAIIERFGKYQKVANSGIHIRLPLGLTRLQHGFSCACCKAILWLRLRPRTMCSL